jgi:hypothetical protein
MIKRIFLKLMVKSYGEDEWIERNRSLDVEFICINN